jgi:hypothetical protein
MARSFSRRAGVRNGWTDSSSLNNFLQVATLNEHAQMARAVKLQVTVDVKEIYDILMEQLIRAIRCNHGDAADESRGANQMENPHPCLSRRSQQLQHVRDAVSCLCNAFDAIPYFAALGNEIVVWIDDEKCRDLFVEI